MNPIVKCRDDGSGENCVDLDVLFIEAIKLGPLVLVVQPIAKIVSDSECGDAARHKQFRIEQSIDVAMPSVEYLLHVRDLNGESYNRLGDLPYFPVEGLPT